MTFREKLAKEHPDCIDSTCGGGCFGCPKSYGYEENFNCGDMPCEDCWNREIPTENTTEKTYEQGLQDAWELARKVLEMNANDFDKAFGYVHCVDAFYYLTPQEALAKLEAYEKEQEIKVGDVVRLNNSKYEYVVTVIYDERGVTYYCGISENGKWFAQSDVIKTGRHIDIESLLGQIRGE